MDEIKVKVDALAPLQLELQLFGRAIAACEPSSARFDTTEDRYQARAHTLALLGLQCNLLFVGPAGGQVDHGAVVGLSQGSTGLADAIGKAHSEALKIFPEHTHLLEIVLHDQRIVEAAQSALESKPIPAVQYSNDIGLMAL